MSYRFPVEAGHIMMFARSVGDANPIYSDADYAATTEPGGVIAPPTFARAGAQFDPEWALRPRIGEPWMGSGRTPTGIPPESAVMSGDSGSTGGGGTSLHAEQHFEYHRHVRPGDVLTCESRPGKTWEKQGRRGGNLHFSESIFEFRDEAGELVVTMRSVGVRTERIVNKEES